MAKIAFIGGSTSGKTTIACLLRQAAVLYNVSSQNPEPWEEATWEQWRPESETKKSGWLRSVITRMRRYDFALDLSPTTQMQFLPNYLRLMDGNEVIPTAIDEFFSYDMTLRKSGIGGKVNTINIWEIAGERWWKLLGEIGRGRGTDEKKRIEDIVRRNAQMEQLLSSDVCVLLLDGAVLAGIEKDVAPGTLPAGVTKLNKISHNAMVALLLNALFTYKREMKQKIRALGIVFVKHDLILNKPEYGTLLTKKDYKRALAGGDLNEVCTVVRTMKKVFKMSDNDIEYFKIGMRTEEREEDGRKVIKPSKPLRFYTTECIRLLQWLAEV